MYEGSRTFLLTHSFKTFGLTAQGAWPSCQVWDCYLWTPPIATNRQRWFCVSCIQSQSRANISLRTPCIGSTVCLRSRSRRRACRSRQNIAPLPPSGVGMPHTTRGPPQPHAPPSACREECPVIGCAVHQGHVARALERPGCQSHPLRLLATVRSPREGPQHD